MSLSISHSSFRSSNSGVSEAFFNDNKLHLKRIQAHVSFDSYQLRLTILDLLFPEIIQKTVFGILSTTEREACFMKFQAINNNLHPTAPKEKSEKKFHSNLINIAKKLTTNTPPQRPTIKLVIDYINKFIKKLIFNKYF